MPRKPIKRDTKPSKRKEVTVKQVTKAMEKVGIELTAKQKLFCTLYLTDKWCFANATQSYAEAYGINKANKKAMLGARSNGYRLIVNDYVQAYLNKMLDEQLEEAAVDRQLAKVVNQNKDLHAKISGIGEYNKLKGRILDKKQLVDEEGKAIPIVGLVIHVPGKKQTIKTGR